MNYNVKEHLLCTYAKGHGLLSLYKKVLSGG